MGKEGVLDIMRTISSNLHKDKSSKGRHHSQCKTTSEFYESLLTIFGPKAVIFAAENLHAQTLTLFGSGKRKAPLVFDFSDQQKSIKFMSEIYKEMKKRIKIICLFLSC